MLTHHHQQPDTRTLVSALPQPRRRRIRTRPDHQHRPPHPPRRTQLPTHPTTQRSRHRLDSNPNHPRDNTNDPPVDYGNVDMVDFTVVRSLVAVLIVAPDLTPYSSLNSPR